MFNLYCNWSASKVTRRLPAHLVINNEQVRAIGRLFDARRSGDSNIELRQLFVLRLVERVVRLLVRETGPV